MKKILFFLVALAFTNICFAQDVIVKKDGSTILAKVLKITETDVEYKAYDNQDGPTRVVSISSLQGINYQNGQKETFSTRNSGIVTNETATQFSNDQQLMQMYYGKYKDPVQTKVKRLKIAGWVVGGALFATGTILAGFCRFDYEDYSWGDIDYYNQAMYLGIGIPMACSGIAIWSGCIVRANKLKKQSQFYVDSAPLFQQEFSFRGNDRLMVGIDMLKDNTMKNQTFGMGLRYNF